MEKLRSLKKYYTYQQCVKRLVYTISFVYFRSEIVDKYDTEF